MPKLISINKLVRRQTAGSKYSHFTGTWKELVENLVEFHFGEAEQGYKEGILVLSLPPEGFFSGVIELDEETPLYAKFAARRQGEVPYIQVTAAGGGRNYRLKRLRQSSTGTMCWEKKPAQAQSMSLCL